MRLKEVSVGQFFHLSEHNTHLVGRNSIFIKTNIKNKNGLITIVDSRTGFFLQLEHDEDVFVLQDVAEVPLGSLVVGDKFLFEDHVLVVGNMVGKNGNIPVSLVSGYSYESIPSSTIVKKFNIF